MGLYDSISRATESVSVIENLLSDKREFLVKQAVNIILLLVILIVFGCLDFAQLKFHGEELLKASFWGTILTKEIAGLCAFNLGINFMWETELKKATELHKQISLYEKLIQYKQLDFEEFINKVFNPTQKKLAYKSKINREIYLLNKFSKRADRLLYSSTMPERQEEKKTNRYCKKRAELEELKSDEYIDKNLDSIIVKYNEIDPAVFELEISGQQKYQSLKITGNETAGRIKATGSVALGMIFFAMFTTALGLEFSQQEFASQMERFWHYVLKCVEDVGVILWQVLKGFTEPRKIISSQLTTPYRDRNRILSEYFIWRKQNKKEDDELYKELHQEEIEITVEDLEKLKSVR